MSTINEMWDDLTSSEQLVFKKCCRRLLKETFIVRDIDDDNRKMFFFVKSNEGLFSDYLNLIGFDIVVVYLCRGGLVPYPAIILLVYDFVL